MCSNCAVLRKRIRELEFELGKQIDRTAVPKVRETLRLHPMPAMALQLLYDAKGRWVDSQTIMGAVGFASETSMRTSMCRARTTLGKESVLGMRTHGYRLTDFGMERMRKILL